LRSIRLQVFVLFEKYDMTHFLSFSLHKGQKYFFGKTLFITYG
jgi:hypothetical protein